MNQRISRVFIKGGRGEESDNEPIFEWRIAVVIDLELCTQVHFRKCLFSFDTWIDWKYIDLRQPIFLLLSCNNIINISS